MTISAVHQRRLWVLALSASLLLLGSAVSAAGSELDFDLMQTIEDTNKELASNVALQDAQAASVNAKDLHDMFVKVEAHFAAKGDAADAVDLSRKSQELTGKIVNAVGSKDFGAATDAATELSRTCRACHTFYKKS